MTEWRVRRRMAEFLADVKAVEARGQTSTFCSNSLGNKMSHVYGGCHEPRGKYIASGGDSIALCYLN